MFTHPLQVLLLCCIIQYLRVSTAIVAPQYTPVALIDIMMYNISRYTGLDTPCDNGCFDASYHGRAMGGRAWVGAEQGRHSRGGWVRMGACYAGWIARAWMHACMGGVEHTIATCILCISYQVKRFTSNINQAPPLCRQCLVLSSSLLYGLRT